MSNKPKEPKKILQVEKEGIENAIHYYLQNHGIVEDDTDYSINLYGTVEAEIAIYDEGDNNSTENLQ